MPRTKLFDFLLQGFLSQNMEATIADRSIRNKRPRIRYSTYEEEIVERLALLPINELVINNQDEVQILQEPGVNEEDSVPDSDVDVDTIADVICDGKIVVIGKCAG